MRVLPLALSALVATTACSAVFPEVATPLRTPPAGKTMDPPPPKDVVYVEFKGGNAPERTRDGRPWQELGNKLPDPYAVLFVNGKELIKTNRQSNTLNPTWPDAPRGNFHIEPSDRIRVEMWESALVAKPMCVKDFGTPDPEWGTTKELVATCEGGAKIVLAWEPARGQWGYGFHYEFRTADVAVTRVFAHSPAARAGMKSGDLITAVDGRPTSQMKPGEVQGAFNASRLEPLKVSVKRGGEEPSVELREGPVYPLFTETVVVAR